MLLGNYSVLNKSPGRFFGTFPQDTRQNWNKSGPARNMFVGFQRGTMSKMSAVPRGTEPPYSWIIAQEGGDLSTFNQLSGLGELSGSMAKGVNATASLSGVGTISTASLSMVVSLISSIAGIGGLSASMVGVVQMSATLVGSGSISAGLNLLANCIASLSGTGTVSANLKGKSYMEADIYVSQATATTEQLVYAIWNAIATQFNEAGTLGEKLNNAGSAGNPWATAITGNTNDGTFGEQVGKKLLTFTKFLATK